MCRPSPLPRNPAVAPAGFRVCCVDWGLGMGVTDLRLGSWGYGQCGVQGYLAYKKPPPPRTVQYDNAMGPVGVLGGWVFSYERSSPVGLRISG